MANTNNLRIGSNGDSPISLMKGVMKEDDTTVYPSTEEVWDAYYNNDLVYHKDKTIENCWQKYKMLVQDESNNWIISNTINEGKSIYLPEIYVPSNYLGTMKVNCHVSNLDYIAKLIINYFPAGRSPDTFSYMWHNSNLGSITIFREQGVITLTLPESTPLDYDLRGFISGSTADSISLNINRPVSSMINFASECEKLTTVKFTFNQDTSFAENCGFDAAFRNCTSLLHFYIGWDCQVGSYDNTFQGCNNLTSITGNNLQGTSYNDTFSGCSSLTSITPQIATINVSGEFLNPNATLQNIFKGCTNLQTFTLNSSLPIGNDNSAYHYRLDKDDSTGVIIPNPTGQPNSFVHFNIILGNLPNLNSGTVLTILSQLQETTIPCTIHFNDNVTIDSDSITSARDKNWYIYKGDTLLS